MDIALVGMAEADKGKPKTQVQKANLGHPASAKKFFAGVVYTLGTSTLKRNTMSQI